MRILDIISLCNKPVRPSQFKDPIGAKVKVKFYMIGTREGTIIDTIDIGTYSNPEEKLYVVDFGSNYPQSVPMHMTDRFIDGA